MIGQTPLVGPARRVARAWLHGSKQLSSTYARDSASLRARASVAAALQERLEEALVFIIHEDGRREFRTMTLRELYNYVLEVIAKRPQGIVPMGQSFRVFSMPQVADVVLNLDRTKDTDSFLSSIGGDEDIGANFAHEQKHGQAEKPSLVESIPIDERESGFSDVRESRASDQKESGTVSDKEKKSSRKRVTFVPPVPLPKTRHVRNGSIGGNDVAITYRERLGGYLHPRDMRRLVTPFSTSNAPEVMVRRHVILLNCDPLRAIVLRDRLILLVPDGADSILETLAKRIGGGRVELEDSVFGDHPSQSRHSQSGFGSKHKGPKRMDSEGDVSKRSDDTVRESDDEDVGVADEWDDLQGRGWIDLPFELQALDAVLHTVSFMLAEEVKMIQQGACNAMDELFGKGRYMGDLQQQVLRSMKNEIKEMNSRVSNFVRALTDVLDEDEDMALMNLSRLVTHPERFVQPVSQQVLTEESDEPELILETYMQQALSTANHIDLLKGQVGTAEELMAMQLDTVRNRLLYVNTVISLITMTVSVAAMVGSIFGMNVTNGLEYEPHAFRNIVAGTITGCFVFFGSLLYFLRKAGTLPNVA